MLQDAIDKLSPPGPDPDTLRIIVDQCAKIRDYAVSSAAQSRYGTICDDIAKKLSQGETDVSGEFLFNHQVELWEDREGLFFRKPDLKYLSLIQEHGGVFGSYDPEKRCFKATYELYELREKATGSEKLRTNELIIGNTWFLFWKALTDLAARDHVTLEAFIRVVRHETTSYDRKTKKICCTETITEQDLPVMPGAHEISWEQDFRRVFENAHDYFVSRWVRANRYQRVLIRYHYQKGSP